MDVAEIHAELIQRGYNFSAIANLLDVSSCHVGRIARREQHNHRIALAIATALGRPISVVFPDVPRYRHPYREKEAALQELARRLADQNLVRRSA